ncbi:hypothetical protein ACL7TT_03410 [Microbulbifer sp. 2304DJ12-6]|uniref:hypothetical protein n=1 Tax=Microbulbifer sp. 2304DJ12-6 TaxID=3233340 RepID=UPI0039AF0E8C
MQAAKLTIFSALFFVGIFSAISLIFYFRDWERLIWAASFGLFVGVVAAPELNRKTFKYPTLLQAMSGGVAGYILAVALSLSPESIFACVGLGFMLGASANIWVKYVQIP